MKQKDNYKDPLPEEDSILDFDPVELPKEDQHYFELFLIFIFSLVSAFVLFFLDVDTTSFLELLTWNGIFIALIYAVPTFVVSSFIYEKLVGRYSKRASILLSCLVGIPLTFLLIIWYLSK